MALRIEAFGVEIDIADIPPILGDFQSVEDSLGVLEPFLHSSAQALLGTEFDSGSENSKGWMRENGKFFWSLIQLVTQDALTGVFNRRFLIAKMEKMLQSLRDDSRNTLGLIMMDIDRFKGFNDLYGHEKGDTVLKSLGKELLHYNDSFNVVSRFGGEEFVLGVPGRTDVNHMQHFHTTILSVAPLIGARLAPRAGHHEAITVSVGGYLCGPNDTVDTALGKVDDAMYLAKAYGRNGRTVILESNGSGADYYYIHPATGQLQNRYLKPAEFYGVLREMRQKKKSAVRSKRL